MPKYWPLAGILAIFILPALTALLLLNFQPIHSTRVEHGIFVPPQKISDLANNWHVLYLDERQQAALHKLHQALGANQSRVIFKHVNKNELNLALNNVNILIIDPQGYYILGYQPGTNLSGVLKDLRRLLKYSHV